MTKENFRDLASIAEENARQPIDLNYIAILKYDWDNLKGAFDAAQHPKNLADKDGRDDELSDAFAACKRSQAVTTQSISALRDLLRLAESMALALSEPEDGMYPQIVAARAALASAEAPV